MTVSTNSPLPSQRKKSLEGPACRVLAVGGGRCDTETRHHSRSCRYRGSTHRKAGKWLKRIDRESAPDPESDISLGEKNAHSNQKKKKHCKSRHTNQMLCRGRNKSHIIGSIHVTQWAPGPSGTRLPPRASALADVIRADITILREALPLSLSLSLSPARPGDGEARTCAVTPPRRRVWELMSH